MNNKPTYEELEKKIRIFENMVEEKIEETHKFQSDFFSNISHNTRTLLNVVLGFSSLLTTQNLTTKKRNTYLENIKRSCENLLTLMENIFDALLLETGQLKIKKKKCMVNQLLDELYYYFIIQKHLQKKNCIALLLTKEISDQDFAITTDSFRLHQVLSNLISNALKFTEKGIIEFGYSLKFDGKLQFFIKDTRKNGLINTQSQVLNYNGRLEEEFGDSNLGLIISERIVDLLGGEFWSETNCFNGSTFKFTIPKKIYQKKESSIIYYKQA